MTPELCLNLIIKWMLEKRNLFHSKHLSIELETEKDLSRLWGRKVLSKTGPVTAVRKLCAIEIGHKKIKFCSISHSILLMVGSCFKNWLLN